MSEIFKVEHKAKFLDVSASLWLGVSITYHHCLKKLLILRHCWIFQKCFYINCENFSLPHLYPTFGLVKEKVVEAKSFFEMLLIVFNLIKLHQIKHARGWRIHGENMGNILLQTEPHRLHMIACCFMLSTTLTWINNLILMLGLIWQCAIILSLCLFTTLSRLTRLFVLLGFVKLQVWSKYRKRRKLSKSALQIICIDILLTMSSLQHKNVFFVPRKTSEELI